MVNEVTQFFCDVESETMHIRAHHGEGPSARAASFSFEWSTGAIFTEVVAVMQIRYMGGQPVTRPIGETVSTSFQSRNWHGWLQ